MKKPAARMSPLYRRKVGRRLAVDSTSWYIRHEAALKSIDAALPTAHAIREQAQVAECPTE